MVILVPPLMYGSPSLAIPPLYRSPIYEGALPYIEDPLFLPPSTPRRGTTFLGKAKLKVSMLQMGGNVDNGFCLDMRGIPKARKSGKYRVWKKFGKQGRERRQRFLSAAKEKPLRKLSPQKKP